MTEAYIKPGLSVQAQERIEEIWKLRETDRSAWDEADIFREKPTFFQTWD